MISSSFGCLDSARFFFFFIIYLFSEIDLKRKRIYKNTFLSAPSISLPPPCNWLLSLSSFFYIITTAANTLCKTVVGWKHKVIVSGYTRYKYTYKKRKKKKHPARRYIYIYTYINLLSPVLLNFLLYSERCAPNLNIKRGPGLMKFIFFPPPFQLAKRSIAVNYQTTISSINIFFFINFFPPFLYPYYK